MGVLIYKKTFHELFLILQSEIFYRAPLAAIPHAAATLSDVNVIVV